MRELLLLAAFMDFSSVDTHQSKFNLVCSGSESGWLVEDGGAQLFRKSFNVEYRVDVVARTYCEGACIQQMAFQGRQGDVVLLEDTTTHGIAGLTKANLLTGDFTSFLIGSDVGYVRVGYCQQAPFSGFPDLD